jgi:hypothetical protein
MSWQKLSTRRVAASLKDPLISSGFIKASLEGQPNVSVSGRTGRNSSQTLGTISTLAKEFRPTRPIHEDSSYSLALTSFGVPFDLSSNQAELIQDAFAYLPLECQPSVSFSAGTHYSLVYRRDSSASQKTPYQIYRNRRLIFRCSDRRDLLERFGSFISLHVAEASPRRTFVHAGVVCWGITAVLIPGRSLWGKTTLVAELVRAGATYYSDEFAVIGRQGSVFPYARPLQVRENGSLLQTQRPVEEFGGIPGSQPLPVGLVIVTRYRPGAQWSPQQLSPGIGLLKILDNTVSARRSPAVALSTLKQVVSDALIVRGVRGEASQVVDWIAAHFGSPRAHGESAE